MHHAPPTGAPLRRASGDERGSVGTGTDERIRQERPTSTSFCIGDVRIIRFRGPGGHGTLCDPPESERPSRSIKRGGAEISLCAALTHDRGPYYFTLPACENPPVATAPKHVTLSDPELAGIYEVVERRPDGSLLLRPDRERLTDVLRETDGVVFKDDEFVAHLERVAATEDDLPAENSA
jgi:hypothetical protein